MRARIELENGDIFKVEHANISIKRSPYCASELTINGYIDTDISMTKMLLNSYYGSRGQFSWKPRIVKVIFNEPATIVLWSDNTKTVVKCQEGDTYSKELGLALCIAKMYLGNQSNFNNEFKKWIPTEDDLPKAEEPPTSHKRMTDDESLPSLDEMREYIKKYCKNSCSVCAKCPIDQLPLHRFGYCFREDCTIKEIITNYKAIKESERHAK